MLQKISIRQWLFIITALIVLQFSSTVLAQVELSSRKLEADGNYFRSHVVSEDAYPIYSTNWIIGRWQLNDLLNLEAGYECEINHTYEFWPSIGKCYGNFIVLVDKEKFTEQHKKKLGDLEDQFRRELDKNPFQGFLLSTKNQIEISNAQDSYLSQFESLQKSGWRLPVKNFSGTSDIFKNIKDDEHFLVIEGRIYEIERFSEIAENGIKLVISGSNNYVKEQKRQIVFVLAIWVFGLAAAWFFVVKLVKFLRGSISQAKLKAQQLKDTAEEQLDKLQAANQRRKVRSVMVDETIREMTRTALNATDDKNKEILIAELRKAIESGNHELANALELALKKA